MKKLFKKIVSLLRRLLGLNYMVNLSSNEIHDLRNGKHNCMTDRIKSYKLIKKSSVSKYLENGLNGCRWCYKSEDKG